MNCRPDTTPRFAVNRNKILSRLPGVRLSPHEKRFGSGRPRLAGAESLPAPVAAGLGVDAPHSRWVRR